MDRGVLDALFVAMRLLLVPCVGLIATGCFLNPQGEDPGFEDGNVMNASTPTGGLGAPGAAPDFGPYPSDDMGSSVTDLPGMTATVPAGASGPTGSSSPGAALPTSTGTTAPDVPATPDPVQPTPEPAPAAGGAGPVGQGGADAASGGAPAGETGGAGGVVAEPGEQFDGGPFNYGSPEADAGPGDAGVDAGDGLIGDTR